MGASDLAGVVERRLANVLLTGERLAGPEDVVRHLTAVQSQDYAPALWSLGQRSVTDGSAPDVTAPDGTTPEDAVHAAFQVGRILRTHVLRPTWHFVLSEDIRWILALTAPRVHQLNAYYYRQLGLDDAAFARSQDVLVGALAGGVHLTRAQITTAFAAADLPTSGLGFAYVLLHAELDGLICSGAMVGRRHTHALLAERAPAGRVLSDEEALAELTLRYFTSHGPATAKDLHWWSSLTLKNIAAGIALVGDRLEHTEVDGLKFFSAPPTTPEPARAGPSPRLHLIQGYDEYVVGYTESKRLLLPSGPARAGAPESNRFNLLVLLDGAVVGEWKRTLRRDDVLVQVELHRSLDGEATAALRAAADDYGEFLGWRAELSLHV